MKTREADNGKKSKKAGPSSHCGDFQKMAGMMKGIRPGAGDAVDCCSIMMKMMGRCKAEEAEETGETRRQPGGGEEA